MEITILRHLTKKMAALKELIDSMGCIQTARIYGVKLQPSDLKLARFALREGHVLSDFVASRPYSAIAA